MTSKKLENKRIPMDNIDFNLDPTWGIQVEYGLLSGHMEIIDDIDTPIIDYFLVVTDIIDVGQDCIIDLTEITKRKPKQYEHLIDDLKMIIYDELMGNALAEPEYWERLNK